MNQAELDALPASVEFPLSQPVAAAGGPIVSVTVREPNRAQIKLVRAQPVDKQEDYAIFTCTGLTPDAIDLLAARDWHKISDWLAPFFQGPQTT